MSEMTLPCRWDRAELSFGRERLLTSYVVSLTLFPGRTRHWSYVTDPREQPEPKLVPPPAASPYA